METLIYFTGGEISGHGTQRQVQDDRHFLRLRDALAPILPECASKNVRPPAHELVNEAFLASWQAEEVLQEVRRHWPRDNVILSGMLTIVSLAKSIDAILTPEQKERKILLVASQYVQGSEQDPEGEIACSTARRAAQAFLSLPPGVFLLDNTLEAPILARRAATHGSPPHLVEMPEPVPVEGWAST